MCVCVLRKVVAFVVCRLSWNYDRFLIIILYFLAEEVKALFIALALYFSFYVYISLYSSKAVSY